MKNPGPSRPAWPPANGLLTITQWLPSYSLGALRSDMLAGLTIGVMLIPQGMAYALLAGVPPIYGLYASLVPLLLYPLFGTSRHLAVGITAIDALIIVAGVSTLAEPLTAPFIELVLLLALMVGVLQGLMGAFRLGFVVNLLSRPVITGFTAAAALTIAFAQLGSLLGLSLPRTPYFYVTLWEAAQHVGDVHLLTFGIGLAGIVLLLGVKHFAPRLPGPLIAVVLATVATWHFEWPGAGVEIVGGIPSGLPMPHLPSPDANLGLVLRELLPTAITLALVQFMSVISLGKVFAAKHRYTVNPNRELSAMGVFNFFGALFRSIPVSGSFSRSAVGDQVGGQTALTNTFAALIIGVTLLFLTPLFYYLPLPIFASIIIVAVIAMVDVDELRFLLRAKRMDGWIALMTFFATLFIGIHQGVLIGIAISVVAIMYRISRPNVAELGHLSGTRSFRDVSRDDEAEEVEGILMLRVDASFSFVNAEFLKDELLERTQDDPDLHSVIIDASSINDLDTTAAAALLSVSRTLAERGIQLYFGGVKEPVMDTIRHVGLYEQFGADHFFLSPHRAVKKILQSRGEAAEYLDDVPGGEAG